MWERFAEWTARVRAFSQPQALDREFGEELEAHLEMLAAEHRRRGLTDDEALRQARVDLGGLAQLREAHREVRGLPRLESVLKDIRYAVRALRRNPGFTAVAVLTLAVGIGVNTAIFTAYDAVVLRPLDAADPDRMVQITRSTRDQFFSYPDYAYYRDSNRSFSGVVAMQAEGFSMGGVAPAASAQSSGMADAVGFRMPKPLHGSTEQVLAAVVSGNYFKVLGVQAAVGRTFLAEESMKDSRHTCPMMLT